MTAERYEYVPLSEEEIYRANDLGELWDRAEAGEPIPNLLRERLRAAERKVTADLQPELERMWTEGNCDPDGGLGKLLEGSKK